MREQLSKRTKSRRVSPPATPKRSPKTGSSKSAKNSPRQKTAAKPLPKKSSGKSSVTHKKTTTSKIASKKKATATSTKKTATKSSRTTTVKIKSKAQIKSVKTKKSRANPPVTSSPIPKRTAKAPTKSPSISRHQITIQALRAFEKAVKVFNLRDFSEAKAMFEDVQRRYQQEVEIIARSQTYIQVCNVRLASNRSLPRNADEFYDRGVVALNVGNFAQARTLFEKALKLRPDDSYTLYSLAATHAQTGSAEQALSYLEQAVQKQPRLRQRALTDTDFSTLKEDRRFLEMLGATSPFDLLEARRELS
jgi:regulator of sirC expression with transglutaminase-like and TPR domain